MATDKEKVKEETRYVEMSLVHADFGWNCRQGGWQEEAPPAEGTEVPEGSIWSLIRSIQANGQDIAVTVRPTGKEKKPYELVTGFRRFFALQKSAENKINVPKGGSPDKPLVKVEIKNLDDTGARLLNGRENIERKNLLPADTAAIVLELVSKHNMPATEIAAKVGLGTNMASQYARIVRPSGDRPGLSEDIMQKWRTDPAYRGVSLDKWEKIAAMPKKDQAAEVAKTVEATGGAAAKGGGHWMTGALKQAQGMGALLGTLNRDGVITATPDQVAASVQKVAASGFITIKSTRGSEGKVTDKQWADLGNALRAGFAEGSKPPEVKPEPKAKEPKAESPKAETASNGNGNGKKESAASA